MSYPLVIRLMLAMALMPDASYGEALARLAGLLADVPFALAWHVPTGKGPNARQAPQGGRARSLAIVGIRLPRTAAAAMRSGTTRTAA